MEIDFIKHLIKFIGLNQKQVTTTKTYLLAGPPAENSRPKSNKALASTEQQKIFH